MQTKYLRTCCSAFLVAAVTSSQALTINFDDIFFPGGNPLAAAQVASGYQGFDWNADWTVSPNDATGWYGGTLQPYSHSGNNFAWSGGGRDLSLTVRSGGTFDFGSFWVRAWPQITFNVTAIGYLNGVQIYTKTAAVTNIYSQVLTNFIHIDRLVLTEIPTANLLLDDLVVSNISAVPEPSIAALSVLGLTGLALLHNRRSRHSRKSTSVEA